MNRFKFTYLKLAIVVGLFLLVSNHGYSQKIDSCAGRIDTLLHKFVYVSVEDMPEPVGGVQKILRELKITKKPPNGVYGGRVIVAFVVDENGKIKGKRIIKDPSGHYLGDQLLKTVDKIQWKIGLCHGKKVPVLYSLPMFIDLQE